MGASSRRGGARLVPVLAALALIVVALQAQAAIRWSSTGSLAASVTDPRIELQAGSGASNSRYVKDLEISTNGSAFTGTVKPKSGADLRVKDVVRIANVDDGARTVTMRADQVSNARYEVFTWAARNATATVATFDYLVATPSASFTIPAGETIQLDLRVDLADGAGNDNAAISFGLWLVVS